ncbi:MAG: DUF3769 domain-containing protein [Cyanobacteria bacterium P01_F01_bin.150]
MPYPVLPPPPPPIVSNEVLLQTPEELEAVADQSISSVEKGYRIEQGHPIAVEPPSIDWASCLASPERLPSESAASTNASANNHALDGSGSVGSGTAQLFCIPPQQQSLSLTPLTSQAHSADLLGTFDQASYSPAATQENRSSKEGGSANIPWTTDQLPEGTEIVEELHFVLETFNETEEYSLSEIHQLSHQSGEQSPDIFVIPLETSVPLIPQRLSPQQLAQTSIEHSTETLIPTILDPEAVFPDDTRPELDLPTIDEGVLEQLGVEDLPESLPNIDENGPSIEPSTILNEAPGVEIDDVPDIPNIDVNVDDVLDNVDDVLDTDTVPNTDGTDTTGPDVGTDGSSEPLEQPSGEDGVPASFPDDQDSESQATEGEEPGEVTGEDALEVTADRQIYDRNRQYFLAEGNALMTFRGALLQADMLRVNLVNQIVVAEGNAVLTRGDQVIRGNRLEYNLVQEQGIIYDAKGEVFLPQTTSDFGPNRPDTLETSSQVPLTDRLATDQPAITASSPGGLSLGVGFADGENNSSRNAATEGTVSRIRFEADEINFTPDGWDATNVRLTNDPFSPPELEIRSRLVTFRRLDANRSELRARRPRLVLDQWLHIPLLRERAIFDSRDRNPAPFQIGFDEEDRGGFFIQRPFNVVAAEDVSLIVTPQFYLQQALENDDGTDETPPDLEDGSSWLDPDLYGLLGELDVRLGSKTSLSGSMELTSFDLGDDIRDDDLRGSVRVRRKIETGLGPHVLTSEYSYRDRLFNGTLGFQTIQKSYGLVLTSPVIQLGDSGVQLTYQGGIQRVNADIAGDRFDDFFTPGVPRPNSRDTLTRYQVAANLSRFYFLWQGTPLPATQDEGLRYTPNPVVPFIAILPSVRGVASFYSSGDTQPILTGELALLGQFGHFSRPYLDFLGFNISYRRSTEGSESPFNFDRVADREVLSGGMTAQLLGPIRIGFQTSINLSQDEEFDNSFIVEYSRRTHGLIFQYNPDRQIGSIGLRISDFNWNGTPEPFGGSGVRTVNDGVLRND